MDPNAIDRHITKMVVLGGAFQLGDLYNCCNNRIVTGRKCWNTDEIARATSSADEFKLKINSRTNNKYKNVGLDEHLQASVMAGLIEKYRGATEYLSDRASPSEASQVLICRAESRKVRLDLQALISKGVPRLVALKGELETLPTHVVVGVTYGAEAYCVLALESGEDDRANDEEYLSEIASKMKVELNDSHDISAFKNKKNTQLTRIKCRLYADLLTSPCLGGSVFNTFKHCHEFIEQVRKGDIRNNKIVPIAVLLCPLKVIIGPAADVYAEYRNVDTELVTRCCRIWEALNNFCAKSAAIRTTNKKANLASFRQFEKAMDKYKQLVQKALGSSIVEARQTGKQDEVQRVANILENHKIFKPSRLERWLRYKQAEHKMICKISSITDIDCLANKKDLEKSLKLTFNKKYSLVLSIPPLDELTNKTLEDMKQYVGSRPNLTKVRDEEYNDESSTDDEEDDVPWHMRKRNQKPVLAKIQELVNHLEKNKDLEKHVQFFIVFSDAQEEFGYRYSVYDAGNLLKDNLSQLPAPPTDLRIDESHFRSVQKASSSSTIHLEWTYADLGLPCLFLVEYRLDDGKENTWNQKKTTNLGETQIVIPYKMGSSVEIRVAADTCIGRSEFSQVVNTKTIQELHEDQEATPEMGFLGSETDTSVSSNDDADTSRKGCKAPDSSSMTKNEETLQGMDQDSDEDDEDMETEDEDDDEELQEETKTSNKASEQHVTKLVVLEGAFQVGDLYDYCSDRVLTDGRKYVDSSKIGSAIEEENNFSLELECSDSSSMSDKMENIGLDEHFQTSFIAGLIEKPRGSSKYLNDCCTSSQAAQVLICRVKSKVVRLGLHNLAIQDVAQLYGIWKKTKSSKPKTKATHIVVGVTYGAEVYCVLTLESGENAREDNEEYLTKVACKMEKALGVYLDLSDFKEKFDKKDKTQLSRVKCRLYADLLTSAFRECGVFEAYKQCLKLIQKAKKTDVKNNVSIPIAILLCPLKAIMRKANGKHFEYHEVDAELVARCGQIWNELDRICATATAIRRFNQIADNASFLQFEDGINKYKQLVQKSLKNGVRKARTTGQQDEIEKVINMVETHSIFSPPRLEEWLQYQQAECDMYEKISGMTNIACLLSNELEMELKSSIDAKYALVLGVPLLNEQMNSTLAAMKNYVASEIMPIIENSNADANRSVEAGCEGSRNLRKAIQRKQKHVVAKIREFTQHVEKNKHLEDAVQFLIVFGQSAGEFRCRYSVYENERLLNGNLNKLPGPPTGLRIRAPKTRNGDKTGSPYAIDLEWDYEDLGFPCYFLVEYRQDGNKNEDWTQRKTAKSGETQLAIFSECGSAIEFRVAADALIGRSEFSEVGNTIMIQELHENEEANEKGFLDSEADISVSSNADASMCQISKAGSGATFLLTSQQPIENQNTEPLPQSASHVVTCDTSRESWKAPDSTSTTKNQQILLRADQDNDENEANLEKKDGDGGDESGEKAKTSNKAIDQHVTELVVLEGAFQVGDLYDYCSDRVLTDGRKYVESSKIGSAIEAENNFSREFKCCDSNSMSDKMENMGLDEHFQASFMAGLNDKPRGSSKYLSDCCTSSQAAQVLICRVKSKVVRLGLHNLAIQDVAHLYGIWEKTKSSKAKTKATHIVVGVTYGAEAYCVLKQDFKDADTGDYSREEAEQYLSQIANQMSEGLEGKQTLAEFKQRFNVKERKELGGIKCNLHIDFQSTILQCCSVFDAYKHYLKFIHQFEKTGTTNNKTIPIAVSLYPLQAIMGQSEDDQFKYHDVDPELFSRYASIWDQLDKVSATSVAIRTANRNFVTNSLPHFEQTLGKYKSLMQTSLKNGIRKAREIGQQNEIEKLANIVEKHAIFKPSHLERLLLCKQEECNMYEKISKMAKNVLLSSKKQVEEELGEAFETNYAMILSLPSLGERTDKILQELKNYTDSYSALVAYDNGDDEPNDNEEDENNMPWNQQKQNHVLSKVREFDKYVEKNKHLENNVRFFMTFCETGKAVGCHYSVYETNRLVKDNIRKLPEPPTNLRIHLSKTSNSKRRNIAMAWDYADLGFPCHFLVEYRLCEGNDEPWAQKRTTKPGETQITIPYKMASAMEFRVAADTCIGRSEFSQVFNKEYASDADDDEETNSDIVSTYSEEGTVECRQHSEMRTIAATMQSNRSSTKNVRTELEPPTDVEVETVTQTTAELGWTDTENKSVSYRVRYWQYGKDQSHANEQEIAVGETGCRLERLQPGTTYSINIVAVSNGGQEMSEPSETVNITTVHECERFAKTMAKSCTKISERNGMDLLAVPLAKSSQSNSTVQRFVFGKERRGVGSVLHKTILVMGATGVGKTTFINGMINYIFNVEWEDPFRFQLIREQLVGSSQSQSQTSDITAYDIYHTEGFRVPYSLTIVDTPGYGDTKGLERDKEITEMIRKFFEDKSSIQNLDIIGFVAQASLPRLTPTQIYIFDSVLSIFGKDVEENIDFLLTFADSQNPPILSAIAEAGLPYPKEYGTGSPRHHKFNNSGFFCSNRESGSDGSSTTEKFNRFFWRMGMENFQGFFSTLATMKTKSLLLTKQVLEKRKHLEATVQGLQPLIKYGLTKMEEMRKTKQMIANSQVQTDANQDVEIGMEVYDAVQVQYNGGYLTNCNTCQVTCHNPCSLGPTENKLTCSAMDQLMPEETRSCTVCPKRCLWSLHENQPYKWEYVKRKKTTSSDAIKEKYEAEFNKKLTATELVELLENDVKKNEATVLQRIDTVAQCIEQLDEIALRPNPFSSPQYIDLIIDAEQKEKRQGFKERIESLNQLRKMAVIATKVKNNETLMSPDQSYNYQAQADNDEVNDNEMT